MCDEMYPAALYTEELIRMDQHFSERLVPLSLQFSNECADCLLISIEYKYE